MSIRIPSNLMDRSRLYEEISKWYMMELIEGTSEKVIVFDDEIFTTRCLGTASGDMENLSKVFIEAHPLQVASWVFAYAAMAARDGSMPPEQFLKARARGRVIMEQSGLVLIATNDDDRGTLRNEHTD